MKILCTADWHIGKKIESFSRLEEQIHVLEQIAQISETEKADAVIVAGDCFDNQTPTPEMTKLFVKTLARLSRGGECPVLVIAGNHDHPLFLSASEAFASQVGVIIVGYPLEEPSLETTHSVWTVTSKHQGMIEIYFKKWKKTVRFLLAPYANVQRLKKDLGTDDTDKKAWELLCSSFKPNISHEEDTINILVSHYAFQGDLDRELPEEDEGERSIIGTIGIIPLESVPEGIDYMILGHIHKPYPLHSNRNIKAFYTGSPLIYSQRETGQKKSVLMLDLSGKGTEYRVPLTIQRNIKKITFNNFDKIYNILEQEKDNYLELIWNGDYYLSSAETRKIREAHSLILRIESLLQSENRPQLDSRVVSEVPTEELFEDYFLAEKGYKPPKDLLTVFQECLSEEKQDTALVRKRNFLPKYLKMKGVYSYKEETEIDFSRLNDNKFFGIFGTTGSGKSAIIEAMVYVLFGNLNRLSMSGSSFSDNYAMMNLESDRMLIEFEFEVTGQDGVEEYKAVFAASRNKKREIKTPTVQYFRKDQEWIPVDQKGEDILGITYGDFCKTIVLQQQDFLGFLSLKQKDTADALKRLFQLERFDLWDAVKKLDEVSEDKKRHLEGQIDQIGAIDSEQLEEHKTRFEDINKSVNDLATQYETQRKLVESLYLARDQQEKLQQAKEEYENLSKVSQEFENAKQKMNMQAVLDKCARKETLSQEICELEETIQNINRSIQEYEMSVEMLSEKNNESTKLLQGLSDKQNKFLEEKENILRSLLYKELVDLYNRITRLNDFDKDKERLRNRITEAKSKSAKLEEYLELGTQLKTQIDKHGVANMLGFLHSGEPCPLCGSSEHPSPCDPIDFEQLEELKRHREEVRGYYQEANAAKKDLEELLPMQQQELEQKYSNELQGFSSQEDLEKAFNKLQEQQKSNDNRLKILEEELSSNKQSMETQQQNNQKIASDLGNSKIKLAELNIKGKSNQDLLTKNQEEFSKLDTEINDELQKYGIPEEQLETIRSYPSKLQKEIDEYFERLSHLKGEIQANTDAESLDINELPNLEYKLTESKEQYDKLQREQGALKQQIDDITKKLEEKEKLTKKHEELSDRCANLNTLKGLFKGKRFVGFVGNKYLDQICVSANKRFLKFTANSLELIPPSMVVDNIGQQAKGICLIDRLNNGAYRDIQTLSGGQRFQAALALALSLADESGAGHRFFFVDEGFGTLDEDNLRQVLEPLRSLTNDEQRIVGLISHVSAIKEEVDICLNVFSDSVKGSRISWDE